MKRYIYCLFYLLSISFASYAQDYYWYKGQKIFLSPGDERYVLFSPVKNSEIDYSSYIKTGVASDSSLMWGIQKQSTPIAANVKYISPSFFIESDSANIYLTEQFYVQLKQKSDYDMLVRYAAEHNVEIIEEGAFQLWYILSCTERTIGNALSMANMFYESGLFAAAEPEFINTIRHTCVDDPLFSQQWNLLNTGQEDINYVGVDINFCEAHAITGGVDSIIIAVIDYGIASHLDVSFLYSYSFDAHTGTYPAQVYDPHGTQCAGIIGAYSDNNHGITGIAPDCSIISVSINDETPAKRIANGIKFAVEHNASVLSNSWKCSIHSSYIDNAIDSALIYGRHGKGCVVVFASGNDNTSTIAYPANCNPDVIAVGAMNASVERASYYDWGSDYGHGLDLIAPGVMITTTIPDGYIGDFCSNFTGTSAACPHVSGVAGLVLSVNPTLTQDEVAYVIESTAQKVGNYNYDSIAAYGSWNYEMGYGLVDAYAAVMKASNIYIQDTTYSNSPSVVETLATIYAGRNVTNVIPQGDVIVPSGSNVHYIAGQSIYLKPGFRVGVGSHFYAEIGNIPHPNTIREYDPTSYSYYGNEDNSDYQVEKKTNPAFETSYTNKLIRNGQLLILRDGKTYTVTGMEIE